MEPILVKNLNELTEIAQKVIDEIGSRRIVAFYGKMGAGKTTLIKSICGKLNSLNIATSPTFSIVNEYKTKDGAVIYHFDFYRVNKIEEIYDIGYEDYFFSGNYCFIEWPEIAHDLLPEETIKIEIKELSDHSRQITFN